MSAQPLVWIIDDDRSIRWVLEKALQKEDFLIRSFESADGVLDILIIRVLGDFYLMTGGIYTQRIQSTAFW